MKMKNDNIWASELDYFRYEETKKQTPLQMAREFQTTFGQDIDKEYVWLSKLDNLRFNLVEEEFQEVAGAETPDHLLKELADLVYVTYGYAATYGWDLDEAVRRVHLSNMSKLDPVTGQPIYREDGKVLKGSDYKEADVKDLV